MIQNISVIICAYTEKRWNELVAAVESVQKQTLPPKEIIVVIDHNPGLLLKVQENLPGIIAVENGEAKGLSGARNSGASMARGDVLAFLDDDAVAQPDWIESLAACYTDSQVVGVGGKINPLWIGSRPVWFPDEFNWVIGCSYKGMSTKNAPVRNLIGANMSMRKDVLVSVGGFRESFGCNKDTNTAPTGSKWLHHHAGDEETEFCIRVSQQLPDSVWLYTPSAVVLHHVSEQRTRWAYFFWRCYDEGLGKANLTKLHGTQKGLSSEKAYTFKVLPKGVIHSLADVLLHGELAGFACAGAIIVGLATTAIGYFVGSISSRTSVLSSDSILTKEYKHILRTPPLMKAQSPIEVQ
jgi:glucosyl-dolichyl phosphate glucuronosyltransferase